MLRRNKTKGEIKKRVLCLFLGREVVLCLINEFSIRVKLFRLHGAALKEECIVNQITENKHRVLSDKLAQADQGCKQIVLVEKLSKAGA